jgi:hypothetical protein
MDFYSHDFYTKLNFSFDLTGIELDTSLLPDNGVFYKPQKYGLAMLRDPNIKVTTNVTYLLTEQDKQKIISQLPKSLLELEVPPVGIMEMVATAESGEIYLPPHIDNVRVAAINVYLQTNGDETTYYHYSKGKVNPIFSFVANTGETYLLNVDKPHSVKLKSPAKRKILTISFAKLSYEEVLNHVTSTSI